jgi:proteic killer suppression protein
LRFVTISVTRPCDQEFRFAGDCGPLRRSIQPQDTGRRAGAALQKLVALNAAISLEELQKVPGNRLEKLRGNRSGQYSIRVNQQLRVCFRWRDRDAYDVEIADYHR